MSSKKPESQGRNSKRAIGQGKTFTTEKFELFIRGIELAQTS